MNDNFSNRRRVPRRAFNKRVGLLVNGVYMVSEATQLGEGGMLIICPQSLEVGQKLVVTFKLPDAAQAVVRGIIRYRLEPKGNAKYPCYGVEFINLDFNLKREIRSFVASKSEQEDAA